MQTATVNKTEQHLSDNQMVFQINQTPKWKKIWNQLTPAQRRWALTDADGDTWHLEAVLEDAKDYRGD